MNDNEEFFLGDSLDVPEFFLGDTIEASSLENETSQQSNSSKEEIQSNKDFEEVKRIYSLLKIQDHPVCKNDAESLKDMFYEYFKENPEIFIVAGKDYFETLNEDEYNNFEDKCHKLIAVASKRWIKIDDQKKLEEFRAAIQTLFSIFRQPQKTIAYSREIKRILNNHLNTALRQKLKDGILEVSEIQELIEMGISIHLIKDSEQGRKAIFDWINKFREKVDFKIESFEDTFVRIVKEKREIDRINTEKVKNDLFKEYLNLFEINAHVVGTKETVQEEILFENMCQILEEQDLLIPNIDFFILDFLKPEIEKQSGRYDFSAPINSEYFYYLKGTAKNIYQLTEDQWRQIVMLQNIRNESDTTNAFIMGTKKEASIQGIAKLIKDNPQTAIDRILAGDLETYFSHIGRKNISIKINKLKEAYNSNKDELITGVVTLLENQVGIIEEQTAETNKEKDNILDLLSKKASAKKLCKFILKNKSDEKLITNIASDSELEEKIQAYFSSKDKKISYINFLMNVLNELIQENDIQQYKYAVQILIQKIQNELLLKQDFLTFITVFDILVNKCIQENLIEQDDNYADTKTKMQTMLDKEKENSCAKEIKKGSFLGFFKKGDTKK